MCFPKIHARAFDSPLLVRFRDAQYGICTCSVQEPAKVLDKCHLQEYQHRKMIRKISYSYSDGNNLLQTSSHQFTRIMAMTYGQFSLSVS